jgi:hypothetical protein
VILSQQKIDMVHKANVFSNFMATYMAYWEDLKLSLAVTKKLLKGMNIVGNNSALQ